MGKTKTLALAVLLGTVGLASCSTSPSTNGDPNLEIGVEGSSNFAVSDVTWDDGSISATIEYLGTCDLVQAELRFSYTKGDAVQTGEEINGIDTYFDVGPLAPNEPNSDSYLGEDKFEPDGITFVFSNEACV